MCISLEPLGSCKYLRLLQFYLMAVATLPVPVPVFLCHSTGRACTYNISKSLSTKENKVGQELNPSLAKT